MIIGLTGKAGSGKDTAAAQFVKNGFEHYWFSKPMKDACKIIFGWTDAHVYGELKEIVDPRFGVSPRIALQTLGTEWGRDCINKDLWVNIAKIKMENTHSIVISDCRYNNEAETIRSMGGVILNIVRSDVGEVNVHTSEIGINPDLINHTLTNNSTIEQLNKKIKYTITQNSF